MGAAIELTKENFESTITDNEIVFVDFWAEWCGPCRSFAPVFENAAKKHEDIVFGKIDTQTQRELAGAFGIQSIPTLMAFRENIMIFNQAGALPPPAFEKLIKEVRGLDMEDVRKQIAQHQAEHGDEAGSDEGAGA